MNKKHALYMIIAAVMLILVILFMNVTGGNEKKIAGSWREIEENGKREVPCLHLTKMTMLH